MSSPGGRTVAGMVLVIIVAFAVGAVGLLILTITAADRIDKRVEVIANETTAIDRDTEAVVLARRTAALARRIRAETAPLSRQLDVVVAETDSISRRALSVRQSAASIRGRAATIAAAVNQINSNASSIRRTVGSIEGRTGGIAASLEAVRGRARSIDTGVARTNRGADRAIGLVRLTELDTSEALAQLGPGHGPRYPAAGTIHGHAHTIDCRVHALLAPAEPQPAYCREP